MPLTGYDEITGIFTPLGVTLLSLHPSKLIIEPKNRTRAA